MTGSPLPGKSPSSLEVRREKNFSFGEDPASFFPPAQARKGFPFEEEGGPFGRLPALHQSRLSSHIFLGDGAEEIWRGMGSSFP